MFVHYSDDPNLELRKDYPYNKPLSAEYRMKPCGLWVSVDTQDGWAAWCEAAEFGRKSFRYEVTLRREAKLLWLRSAKAIERFNTEYAYKEPPFDRMPGMAINWRRLSPYQGIMIFPLQYRLRLEYLWYNGWDCASGCIWDISAIKTIRRTNQDEHIQTD